MYSAANLWMGINANKCRERERPESQVQHTSEEDETSTNTYLFEFYGQMIAASNLVSAVYVSGWQMKQSEML